MISGLYCLLICLALPTPCPLPRHGIEWLPFPREKTRSCSGPSCMRVVQDAFTTSPMDIPKCPTILETNSLFLEYFATDFKKPQRRAASCSGLPKTCTTVFVQSTEMRSPVTLPATSKRKLPEGSKKSKLKEPLCVLPPLLRVSVSLRWMVPMKFPQGIAARRERAGTESNCQEHGGSKPDEVQSLGRFHKRVLPAKVGWRVDDPDLTLCG